MKKRLFKVHTYTEYRVFIGLKYLILYGCNGYPKSDHEIASVDATVYERVNIETYRSWNCVFSKVIVNRCSNIKIFREVCIL